MRGAIESSNRATADIRGVVWQQPDGVDGAIVTNHEGGNPYYVSNPPGKTVAPGTIIPVGSLSGAPHDFVLVGPPTGNRGAPVGGGIRRQVYRQGPSEPPAVTIHAVAFSGLTIALLAYNDATYLYKVAQFTATAPEPGYQSNYFIQSDPLGLVQNGTVVFWGEKADTSHSIVVDDIQGGAEYTYDAAAGTFIFALTQSLVDGYLYWLEASPNGAVPSDWDVAIKKAKADLTSQSTVGSYEALCTRGFPIPLVASSNAFLILDVVNDQGQHFYMVHRVTMAGAFSSSALYERSAFNPLGLGLPVHGVPDSAFGYFSAVGDPDPIFTEYAWKIDTTVATEAPTRTQALPLSPLPDAPTCFNSGGTRVMTFDPTPHVAIYQFPDTSSAPLVDVDLDDPVGSGYALADIFGAVFP